MFKNYGIVIAVTITCLGMSASVFATDGKDETPFDKSSAGGKYNELITTFDLTKGGGYQNYVDDGFYEATRYRGKDVPAGYWVYAYPTLYVWKNKDLDNINFEISTRKIKLEKIELEVLMEHHKDNKEWADRLLDLFAAGVPEMENRSGVPFPGSNPYLIYESPNLPYLGLTGPTGMALCSPPGSTEWVLLHEAIHIWNSNGGPSWICEGLCDYIGYLLMLEFDAEFRGDETFEAFLEEWRVVKNTEVDSPLMGKQRKGFLVSAGKTMDYWQILHQQLGDEFVNACFHKNSTDNLFDNDEFEEMLKSFGVENPKTLMSGWLIKGKYAVENSNTLSSATP